MRYPALEVTLMFMRQGEHLLIGLGAVLGFALGWAWSSWSGSWSALTGPAAGLLGAILGAAFTHFSALFRDGHGSRKKFEAGRLILLHEVASRAAHCAFDYEVPWRRYGAYDPSHSRKLDQVVKFAPLNITSYGGSTETLAGLRPKTARAVIMFHNRLAAWGREVGDAEKLLRDDGKGVMKVTAPGLLRLSRRLGEVLQPAKEALALLADEIGEEAATIIADHFIEYYRLANDRRLARVDAWLSKTTTPMALLTELAAAARELKEAEKRGGAVSLDAAATTTTEWVK